MDTRKETLETIDRWLERPKGKEAIITSSPDICSGQPVITGTRFPVSRLLVGLACGGTFESIALDWDVDKEKLRMALLFLSSFNYLPTKDNP